MKKLALIILNWNGTDDTIECLKSLNNRKLYDIYVLDNGSKKEEVERLESYLAESQEKDRWAAVEHIDQAQGLDAELYLIKSAENLGFAKGNNYISRAICHAYDYLLLLNNDTEVPDGTIESMLDAIAEHGDVALTCDIRSYYHKEELWNAGGKFMWYGDRKYYSQKWIDQQIAKGVKHIRAEFITGCALLLNSVYVRKYGLFTEDFFHGEEDYNFCLKIKNQGMTVGVDLTSKLYHKVGRSIQVDGDDQRAIRKTMVHYCNRIIDYKKIYPYAKWKIWRVFYLLLVFVRRVLTGMNMKSALQMCATIHKITNDHDQVDYELFRRIMTEGR